MPRKPRTAAQKAARSKAQEKGVTVRLDTVAHVRAEQGRLYRMLFSPKRALKSRADYDRARRALIDIRETLLAEAGTPVPGGTVVTNNTLVVPAGLPRTD